MSGLMNDFFEGFKHPYQLLVHSLKDIPKEDFSLDKDRWNEIVNYCYDLTCLN